MAEALVEGEEEHCGGVAKRLAIIEKLEHPAETIFEEYDFSNQEGTGKYVCSVCGYVYDPAEHDGVAFEDLPEDWKCPRCRQPRTKFSKA